MLASDCMTFVVLDLPAGARIFEARCIGAVLGSLCIHVNAWGGGLKELFHCSSFSYHFGRHSAKGMTSMVSVHCDGDIAVPVVYKEAKWPQG